MINITLTVFFDTDRVGDYKILVNLSSKSPKYQDWGEIHINLQRINESQIREIMLFTEELIVEHPECAELNELLREVDDYLDVGDFSNAKLRTEQIVDACKDAIAQVSLPRQRNKSFIIGLYFALAVLVAFFAGIIYYFIQRRRISRRFVKLSQKERLQKV